MSFLSSEEIPCTYCQFPNQVEIWTIINPKEDPELRDLLLGGEINMADCQSCLKVFYAEHFVLYHDPDIELMAFVYPLSSKGEAATFREKTAKDFSAAQAQLSPTKKIPYEPITLFGLDELISVLQEDEENSIQGNIVSLIAQDKALNLTRLRPAKARELNLPCALPLDPNVKGSKKKAYVDAVDLVLKSNDLLSVYHKARKVLTKMDDAVIEGFA